MKLTRSKKNIYTAKNFFIFLMIILSHGSLFGQENPIGIEMIGEGIISTPKSEFKPAFFNQGKSMIFTRSDKNYKNQVLMISNFQNGNWGKATPISFSDILYNDSAPFVTSSGKTLYFVSTRPKKGMIPEIQSDIWKSTYSNGIWQKPVPLNETINTIKDEFGPCLYNSRFYFSGVRDSGSGFLDIYYSEMKDGKFSKPVNLGKEINSDMNEYDPNISSDGKYLVFSSYRKKEPLGRSDIYICEWKNGNWSKPVNAGALVNTKDEETSPVFSPDNQYLYFSSNRYDDTKIIDGKTILNGLFNMYKIPTNEILKTIHFE